MMFSVLPGVEWESFNEGRWGAFTVKLVSSFDPSRIERIVSRSFFSSKCARAKVTDQKLQASTLLEKWENGKQEVFHFRCQEDFSSHWS
ncbi:hypothetical protein DMENIID0001_023100 [Sergentomyia squamirostris]